ncbi:DUF4755 domain-containing protein [Methylophaga sp.]|uniref:DUF4755 domain-containing protein n=1 Tax=Methylophaga sp. TaxID=2024840 RepID=UPI002720CA29|nr:DUF4755 domain-containing protein [Methylophaga sp.]MDO8826136.1 DUF4755 domain-containing protein [Methylophaga sp.]
MSPVQGWWIIAAGIIGTLIPWLCWIGLLMIGWGIWKLWRDKRPGNDPWLKEKEDCQFKTAYDGTGLALDTATKTIHLKNKNVQKSYPFEDIREWKYNVQTGGQIINGSAGTNYGIHMRNKAESGLFVTMRDIEHPQWRIAFPYNKKMEGELLKWMEIFRQHVNNE